LASTLHDVHFGIGGATVEQAKKDSVQSSPEQH